MLSFKAGDVVRLKSGGPKMTITAIDGNGGMQKAICAWFDGPRKIEDAFALEALEPHVWFSSTFRWFPAKRTYREAL